MPPLNESDAPKQGGTARERIRTVLISVAIVVAVATVYGLLQRISQRAMPKPDVHAGVGQPLSSIELRPLTGDAMPVSLADLKNHVTLLNFWGTWCPPCRDELPHIARLRQRFAGQEAFRLLAVSCPAGGQSNDVQSLRENTAALLKQLNVRLPTYHDPDGGTEFAVRKLIADQHFPTTILLDRRGTIRAVWVGYRPGVETEMERYISMVLEESN
jgi:cytochrome c biogenesis protein CcmG, thiol:disulfide interchange protein DsbE